MEKHNYPDFHRDMLTAFAEAFGIGIGIADDVEHNFDDINSFLKKLKDLGSDFKTLRLSDEKIIKFAENWIKENKK